jgi:hypothetical protein
MRLRLLAIAALVLFFACAGSGYETARRQDTKASYRRFLRERPEDPAAESARERLAELEFLEARRQNSPLGYKRFLEEFPQSPRRGDAQILLENLRFEVARGAGTSLAWNEFLRDHPSGAHADAARAALDAVDFEDAKKAGTAVALQDYLARHPETANRTEAERLVDDRLFIEAREKGPRALVGYLDASGAGVHRDEARAALLVREALARAQVGDFGPARRKAELVVDLSERRKLSAALDEQELEWVAASLEPARLETFATRRPDGTGERARALARALRRDPKELQELRALAARLDPARYARPAPELLQVLSAGDPRERWLAAEELGRMGARQAIDPLLDAAAGSRFARVRSRALAALQSLFALLPIDALEVEVRARAEALRKLAQGPALQVRLSILEDLMGDEKAALEDYARALRGDAADLLVLRRIASLRARRGEAFSAAVAARDLATRVLQAVERREGEEGASPALLARTLCGARDDAQDALALLQAMPAAAAAEFPEDLGLFRRRAEEATRLASARLSDAEARARAEEKAFRGCDDDGGLATRLADGESDRRAAVTQAAQRKDSRLQPALARVARFDPSADVRAAARDALERMARVP